VHWKKCILKVLCDRREEVFCKAVLMLVSKTPRSRLPGVFITGESRLPGVFTTGKSSLPVVFITRERFWTPGGVVLPI
jgi:hypothetical protein